MNTRHILAGLLILAAFNVPRPAAAQAMTPVVSAPEAIVVDGWTGSVLFAKRADVPRYPASTVKIMTALLVLDRHIPLARVVTVSPFAASYGGSTAGLYAGERMTVWNLLHGMLLPSGNDAAIALSESVAGTSNRFVRLMNRKAWRMHLWHTHFLSPNGFDIWGQVTTARDLATLARVAMHRPAFAAVASTKIWTAWSSDNRIEHRWTNLNKLLWRFARVDGVKTGTTPGAGACLVSSAHQRGRWVIAINMGSSIASRFDDGSKLLNYGLAVDAGPPTTD
ncbi:MAG: hypothetical protein PVSMB7_19980 [Chloroflexota bacterium]